MSTNISMRGDDKMISNFAILLCGLSLMGMPLETSVPAGTPTFQTNSEKVFTYSLPPSGFDPLTASDAELAKYGFPPRPDPQTAPALYEQWRTMVSAPRTPNPSIKSTNIYNGPVQ